MVIFTYLVLIMGIFVCYIIRLPAGNWCSNLIGWRVFVWCKRVANADCLNKFSFLQLRGQVMGAVLAFFSGGGMCVWKSGMTRWKIAM